MAREQVPLSTPGKVKLTLAFTFLFISIPAAIWAGYAVGSDLMLNLREQVTPFQESDDPANTGQRESYDPWELTDAGAKLAQTETPAPDGAAAPAGSTEPEAVTPDDLLVEAPEVRIEPLNFELDALNAEETEPSEAPGDDVALIDPDQAPSPERDIFTLEGEEENSNAGARHRITLGSYISRANASALVEDLQSHGYASYIEKAESNEHGVIYRVVFGTSYDTRSAASEKAEEFRRLGYQAWNLHE